MCMFEWVCVCAHVQFRFEYCRIIIYGSYVWVHVDDLCSYVRLNMNGIRTKYLVDNFKKLEQLIYLGGKLVNFAEGFLYLGENFGSTKGIDWKEEQSQGASQSLGVVRKSDLRKSVQVHVVVAAVECVLLHRCETWTLIKKLVQIVYGCYARILRMALNIDQYTLTMKNSELYETIVEDTGPTCCVVERNREQCGC